MSEAQMPFLAAAAATPGLAYPGYFVPGLAGGIQITTGSLEVAAAGLGLEWITGPLTLQWSAGSMGLGWVTGPVTAK